MKDHDSFEGLGVLITGGSKGLGRALGVELGRRGARVVLVARGESSLAEAVGAVRAAGGVAFGLAADVGDKEAIWRIAGQANDLVGPIDLVVHAASTLGPTPLALLLDTDCEALERALAVNLVGPFRLTKALAGSMALRRTGTVVFVSSDAAVNAYPRWGAYAASKAAADHLARTFAEELRESGVRVLAVDPGEMDTELHHLAMPDADPSTLARPELVARCIVAALAEAETGSRLVIDAPRAPEEDRAPGVAPPLTAATREGGAS